MSAKILDGRLIGGKIQEQIAKQVVKLRSAGKRPPGLAVILVGDDYASQVYVRHKRAACEKVGMISKNFDLPVTTNQLELLRLINNLNRDSEIDGILVQLPLPAEIDETAIVESISPNKDVDGFHPFNLGRLTQGRPVMRPCTPAGIMLLLEHTKQDLTGKNATVIGASNIVGKPMVMELIAAGMTVTNCHSRTQNLESFVKNADLLVVATGNPKLIKGAWIKPGCIVIDVGTNRGKDGKITGDVEYETAKEIAGWITPVPGGVGPMTIASLLQNTYSAYELME